MEGMEGRTRFNCSEGIGKIMRILSAVCLLIVSVTLIQCVQHSESNISTTPNLIEQELVEVKYAEGFNIVYQENFIKIITHSFDENTVFEDSVFIVLDSSAILNPQCKIIQQESIRLACQSSTHLAFLDELERLNNVVGLCGLEYVNNVGVSSILSKNEVVELCMADQVLLENLYQSNSDLFFIYPFGNAESKDYSSKGIQTLLIAEYLEKSQLARLEWIKLFGVLTGRTKEANAYFEEVEQAYLQLKNENVPLEKTFIMNLPFQDQWFMPSSKSVGVELIEDAGIEYFYHDEKGTENIMHSNEQVWNDGIQADYWVIIARRPSDFKLADLIAEVPVYKEFHSVQNQQVIFCNTNVVDYFSKGVIEPHIILKDLCYATGQIESHSPQYFFLLE
ncbi:MAG: iron complex transport system substrate-binding protein [Crocinitomix sp.]|jgi:iron complex transport system substrate-binding protein